MGGADLDTRLQQAKKAFSKQLADLRTLRGSYTQGPNFIRWRNTTTEVFKRFLPESESFSRFMGITFEGGYFDVPTYPDDPRSPFNRGLTAAGACLESAVEYLELFGLDAGVVEQRVAANPAVAGEASDSAFVGPDKIFLGHGRSLLWHKVERYLEKDKKLPVEAWESVSHSGEQVVAVLEGLLNSCTFAVLVVTGEDEMAEGAVRARQNVVHEIGLFQGRLGFRRVALLEQRGTESFSNIDGLQTIPFPDQTIEASFPELERMLKRESVIK